MSNLYQSLAHSKWDCKYHVVFTPKHRQKALFGKIRKHLGAIFRALASQKECTIIEGKVMPDHVHMCIAIPPKHAVASVIGLALLHNSSHDTKVGIMGRYENTITTTKEGKKEEERVSHQKLA